MVNAHLAQPGHLANQGMQLPADPFALGGVNVTLGLPIIRTSVDHGTALDLAGSGRADAGSLFAAIELAIDMAAARATARAAA